MNVHRDRLLMNETNRPDPDSSRPPNCINCTSAVVRLISSWWWAEKLPETWAVVATNKQLENYSASVGFIHKQLTDLLKEIGASIFRTKHFFNFFETSVTAYQSTRRNIREDPNLQISTKLKKRSISFEKRRFLFLISNFRRVLNVLWFLLSNSRRLNFICRRFGTLCLFHLHRRVGSHSSYLSAYEDGTECSETSAYKI